MMTSFIISKPSPTLLIIYSETNLHTPKKTEMELNNARTLFSVTTIRLPKTKAFKSIGPKFVLPTCGVPHLMEQLSL